MARLHARPRSRTRGVTPIAAAVAALAVGLGASGLWWAQSRSVGEDAETSSRSDANQVQIAAQSFHAQHAEGCPTLSQLEEEHYLDRASREDDAWGNRFRVHCGGGGVVVRSAGADGQANTADDIRVPR